MKTLRQFLSELRGDDNEPAGPVLCLRWLSERVCNATDTTTEGGAERTHSCGKDAGHPDGRHVCSCFWVWRTDDDGL